MPGVKQACSTWMAGKEGLALHTDIPLRPGLQQERGGSMALQYCITRGAPGAPGAGTACPARMEHFAFAPIDTLHGSFRLAVDYAPSSTVTVLKDSTAQAPMAQVSRAAHAMLMQSG